MVRKGARGTWDWIGPSRRNSSTTASEPCPGMVGNCLAQGAQPELVMAEPAHELLTLIVSL